MPESLWNHHKSKGSKKCFFQTFFFEKKKHFFEKSENRKSFSKKYFFYINWKKHFFEKTENRKSFQKYFFFVKYFLDLKKKLRHSFDVKNRYLSIYDGSRAIPALFHSWNRILRFLHFYTSFYCTKCWKTYDFETQLRDSFV